MFIWLGIALFIDGIDGTFARRLHVAELLPRWSGDVLDLVVDILNYVFVPAYALVNERTFTSRRSRLPLGVVIVVTGSLYFADRSMKTSDYYFRGFPALWNVAAFYLFLLRPAPWLSALAVIALAVLTFVPFHFIHPMRIAHLRAAHAQRRWCFGRCSRFWPSLKNLEPGFWTVAALCVSGCLFSRHRLFAPPSSLTAAQSHQGVPHGATCSSHCRRQPGHRRIDGASCRRTRL